LSEAPDAAAQRQAANADVLLSKYPARALKAGEQGPVYFNVKLDKKGHPLSCQVTKSSGYPKLDEETCNLVLLHMVFQPVKDESGRDLKPTHEGVINWKIPAGATVGTAPARVAAAPLPEKKICKRTPRIGTLAGFERTCMTKREWARSSEDTKGHWEETQGKGHTNGN
jgi:TonB family protein